MRQLYIGLKMRMPSSVVNLPELQVAIFSYLLHFQWELFQMPLFSGFDGMGYYDAILHCWKATIGDVAIAATAFLVASAVVRSRSWLLDTNRIAIGVFFFIGIIITVIFELLATGPLDRWEYSGTMPVVPYAGVGVSPLVQWLVLPALVFWFSRRQLLGRVSPPNNC